LGGFGADEVYLIGGEMPRQNNIIYQQDKTKLLLVQINHHGTN
jgi:hypothetical protein